MIPDGIYATPHFLAAMRARDIDAAEVADCLRRPDIIEPHEGRRRYVKNGLVVVVAHDGALVTALLRSRETWDNAAVRARA